MSGTRLLLFLGFVSACSSAGISIGIDTRERGRITKRMLAFLFIAALLCSLLVIKE